MATHKTSASRVIATLCACGLVAASAGFGSIFAWTVGSQHSIPLAVLSVVMALALEGIKPLAVSQAFQSFQARQLMRGLALALLALVAVSYSLLSEISLTATSKGDLAAHRQSESRKATEAQRERDRISGELTSFGIVRPSAAILGELNPILSDRRLNDCEGWLPGIRYRTICIEQVAPLRVELAKAQRREALEAQLLELRERTGATGLVADPGSVAIGTYLETMGFTFPREVLTQWLILVPVFALELGSALAILIVQVGHTQPSEHLGHVSNGHLGTSNPGDTLRSGYRLAGGYPVPRG